MWYLYEDVGNSFLEGFNYDSMRSNWGMKPMAFKDINMLIKVASMINSNKEHWNFIYELERDTHCVCFEIKDVTTISMIRHKLRDLGLIIETGHKKVIEKELYLEAISQALEDISRLTKERVEYNKE